MALDLKLNGSFKKLTPRPPYQLVGEGAAVGSSLTDAGEGIKDII